MALPVPGTPYPCANPPFSRPVSGLTALPAPWPSYVIPCSHLLDPPYAQQLNPNFPYPRTPRAFESETRAGGTGLIWGPQTTTTTVARQPWCTPWTPWNPVARTSGGSCCG